MVNDSDAYNVLQMAYLDRKNDKLDKKRPKIKFTKP